MSLHEMLQQAKSEGLTINTRHAKILFCGGAKAGKTSFSRLLRSKTHKTDYESTHAGKSKQILLSEKVSLVGSIWVNLNSELETQQLTDRMILKLRKSKDMDHVDDSTEPQQQQTVQSDKQSVAEVTHTGSFAEIGSSITTSSELKEGTSESFPSSLISGNQTPGIHFKEVVDNMQFNKTDNSEPTRKESSTERDMINLYSRVNKPISELKKSIPETWDLFTLLDTGGQPEFINMLPAINASTDITFVVLDISEGKQCLDSPVIGQYVCKDHNHSSYELKYTNKDLLKCLLSSVKVALMKNDIYPKIIKTSTEDTQSLDSSQQQIMITKDKQFKPVVCIIGTHADVLKDKFEEKYDDELREINKEVKKIVEEIDKKYEIDFLCPEGNFVVPIDNTIPRVPQQEDSHDEDLKIQAVQVNAREMVKKIHKILNETLRNKAYYEVPISWFILELELRKNSKVCIPLTEVEEISNKIIPPHRRMNLNQIKEVLRFYHLCGTLLYFDDIESMNEYVITDPQWLFNNLAKIMMCKFENNATVLYGTQIKDMDNGICDMKLLSKLNLDQDIKLESFINLLIHLKIVAPMENRYFIPNLLPVCVDTESILTEEEYGTMVAYGVDGKCIASKVEPFLIEFTSGTIPRGLFGFLIVQLLQDKSGTYELYGENDSQNHILCRCSNLITFYVRPCLYISLIDRISYLELQVRVKYNEPTYHCKARTAITDALEKVCHKFNWPFSDCRYGYLCCERAKKCSQSLHLALLPEPFPNEFPKFTQCKNQQDTKLNEAHLIWFEVCELVMYIATYML